MALGTSLCDGVFENSAFETSAALAATPTTRAPLLMLAALMSCDHMFLPHLFAYAMRFLTRTTRQGRGFLIGERYYFRRVSVIDGMTVMDGVVVLVALPARVPVDVVRYA